MNKLSLDDDISKELEASDSIGLDEIARLLKKITTPSRFRLVRFFRGSSNNNVEPFICIIDIPKDATENDVVDVLTSASQLKEAAGKSVVTIACRRKFYGDAKLRLDLDDYDIISPVYPPLPMSA